MKNLKKVLAVVLAFAMIIGTNAFAASFSDLDKSASYAEAVSVLADLGILTGYEDGTVKPEGDITRAEFAAIVCRIKGLENAANSAKGTTTFTDVAADSWASGYINMASQQGIINGVGGGLFLPDENVKFEEAVKMVVAALGYTPQAESLGGYPTGYLAVASQNNITRGVAGVAGAAANRGTVARLAYNSLDVPMMEQTSFGSGSVEYQPGNKILLDSLGLVKVDATITEIPGSSGQSNSLKADEVRLVVNKHYIAYDGKLMMSEPLTNNTYSDLSWKETKAQVGTTNAQDFLNRQVIAYLDGAYDDEVIIKAIVEKSGRTEEYKFASEDIYDRYTKLDKGEIAFYDGEGSSSYTRATLDENEFDLYINDIKYDSAAEALKPNNSLIKNSALATFKALVEQAQNEEEPIYFDVTLLNNDTDSEFDVAYVDYYTDMVVDETVATTKRVVPANDGASAIVLDPEERNASFTIENADGSAASFDDIKEESVLSIKKGIVEGQKLITGKVIILDSKVTGKITEVSNSDKEVTVDGKTYKVETGVGKVESFDTQIRTNSEATFYINARGNIFWLDESTIVSNMKVGFATKIGKGTGISTTKQIQIMNEEGTFAVYDFAAKVTINDGEPKVGQPTVPDYKTSVNSDALDLKDVKVLDITDGSLRTISETSTVDMDTITINAPITYDLNADGKVSKLNLTPEESKVLSKCGYGFTQTSFTDSEYKANAESLGGAYVTDKTLLFSITLPKTNEGAEIPLASANLDENSITIMKRDALVDGYQITASAVNCDKDGQAKAIFGIDLANALVADANLMIVTGVSSTTNAAGDNVTRLTGLMNGEEVTVMLGDLTDGPKSGYAKGDVVVYQSGATDEARKIVTIFSVADVFDSTGDFATITNIEVSGIVPELLEEAPSGDDVEFYFGYARNRRNSTLTLCKGDDDATEANYVDVTFRNANFTVFDKFEGRDPRIEAGSLADIEADKFAADSEVIGDYVFVRVVDGIATDAVIVKTPKN